MSEFESKCSNEECGEVFEGTKGPCPKCGNTTSRIITMDGMTNSQIARQERESRFCDYDDDDNDSDEEEDSEDDEE